jgi:YfiH family protein
MNRQPLAWLTPDWPLPAAVRVCATLRAGGVSEGSYATLNLATHVGDRDDRVAENRRRLRTELDLPGEPMWLNQVHGAAVARHDERNPSAIADAAIALEPGQVCAVLTADCLPVVLADRAGTRVAVAHGGWRGLIAGVLESTIAALNAPPSQLAAWLGPAISQTAFEVGGEVREAFLAKSPEHAGAFATNARVRYQADLYRLARLALERAGVSAVYGGGWCTFGEPERFFSYRRDGGRTGRIATLAWLE